MIHPDENTKLFSFQTTVASSFMRIFIYKLTAYSSSNDDYHGFCIIL